MTHKIDGGGASQALRAAELSSTSTARTHAGGDRSQPVAAATPADSMRLTGEATGLQALERSLGGGGAGLDVAKVNEVRVALADGSYQIDAKQIASRMLALESELLK